jgi:uncharacterized protein
VSWPESLDVGALISAGWQPSPFRSFVIKVHARCNLKCDYCYMYEMADQTWRARPKVISRATIDLVAFRIAEHAQAHGMRDVEVILHGGEPLLAGAELISYLISAVRAQAGDGIRAHMSVQTNGTILNRQLLNLFEKSDVMIGISLDGEQEMNDRHRRYADGSGSHAQAAAAASVLSGHRLFGGFLSVVDLRNDPVRAYESLLAFSPPVIDFMLPHGNWSAPPPGRGPAVAGAPYGDWLIAVFDRWYSAPEKETRIRLFEEIIHLLLGGSSAAEGIGLSPVTIAVVESDGSIEQSDMLKAAYPAAAATGLDLARHSFDSALLTTGIVARQLGIQALAPSCLACPVARICGGGLYPHRYRAGTGFANPTVYCPDLYRLISHIRGRVVADLTPLARSAACP